jgi:dTMP kinase
MLIVIEGIDGAGKSTLAQGLAYKLTQEGYEVVLTKEPGGSLLGKQLREILQTQIIPITPVAEYLLFAADRAQHIKDVVQPALMRGAIVISDRMADSSLAYQGYGRGIDKENIRLVNEWAMQKMEPDIVFYLKMSAQDATQRIKKRTMLTTFEKENSAFVEQLIIGFDTIFADRSNVITIDGMLSPENVTSLAYKAVNLWQQQSTLQQ